MLSLQWGEKQRARGGSYGETNSCGYWSTDSCTHWYVRQGSLYSIRLDDMVTQYRDSKTGVICSRGVVLVTILLRTLSLSRKDIYIYIYVHSSNPFRDHPEVILGFTGRLIPTTK